MLEIDNIIYFDNDDDFYAFAVNPSFIINECSNNSGYYYDFNFTNDYNNAIGCGKSFMIRDKKSKVNKHKCVYNRTVCKQVDNLKPYYGNWSEVRINKKIKLREENGD